MVNQIGAGRLGPAHLENVFRTNVQSAYTHGQNQVLEHPLVSDEFPYAEYFAIHDGRVRPEHRVLEKSGLDGTGIYRRDDPVWQQFQPPWDYN